MLTIANECGIDTYFEKVCDIYRNITYFLDLNPIGNFVERDFYEIGGIVVVKKELKKTGFLRIF